MSQFVLSSPTEADLPVLAQLMLDAWRSPFARAAFPPTPELKAWWAEYHRRALADPSTHFVVVRDTADNNTAVGLAQWTVPDAPPNAFARPEHPSTNNAALTGPFFGVQSAARERFMGDRRHCHFRITGTAPAYQRRGVGTMLVTECCDLADREGLEVYLSASPEGYPLYLNHGFELVGEEKMPRFDEFEHVMRFMIRQPKAAQ